jgi:4-aminobutyrate aminotransferase-like enzyme/Ser/Thr protein kinase RdoA (MazF antagonist)
MSLMNSAPSFSETAAAQIAGKHYGLEVTASHLPSERDQNFLLIDSDGPRYVLKIANALEQPAILEAQMQAMTQIAGRGGRCPTVVPAVDGSTAITVQDGAGRDHLAWLVTYLPGRPLGDVRHRNPELVRAIGQGLGDIDQALIGFEHPALVRDFHWDLAGAPAVIQRYLPLVTDPAMVSKISAFLDTYDGHVAPHLPAARRMVIHNDANDYNILVGGSPLDRNQQFVGLVDFGDMVSSYLVAEPAVALAYLMLKAADPLAVAADLVSGYNERYPLLDEELELVFPLALLRLCLSVCLAAHQQRLRPDNDYLTISQEPIRSSLPRLLQVPWGLAAAVLRQACTRPANPTTARITSWLQDSSGRGEKIFAPLLDIDLQQEPVLVLDLGVASPLLKAGEASVAGPQAVPEPVLTRRIWQAMDAAGAPVAVGQYGEPRLIYSSPAFYAPGCQGRFSDERRTIHLGLDLFCPAGSTVYAPLGGTVAALADNHAPQDYGPVVVLEHETGDDAFYTLYGHLSRESLDVLEVGQAVARGQQLATVGAPAINGGWPPHLHFQIITAPLGPVLEMPQEDAVGGWSLTDFPGVAPASQELVWRDFSPDPNLIAGIPADRFPSPQPDIAETMATRRRVSGHNLSLSYRHPLKIVRGWMQYLFDHHGRQFLDAYNNVPHVGHCHPEVVAAGERQMALLNTNTRYLHDLFNRYAEQLGATMPGPLEVCYFLNSASEANELALRLARAYTGRKEMIVLEAAYHGHTTGLIDISPYKHAGPGGQGPPPWVYTAPIPDGYRGPYKSHDPLAGAKYAGHVASLTAKLQAQGQGPAGFIAETFPSVGGQVIPPPGYLPAAYRAIRAAGGLCIADEVQTGYGRIGSHFYAFEAQDVVPDIVVLGKPIGNGHPLAAVVTTRAVADAFDNGMEFFSTFGGNTVSCAVGLSVLDVLVREDLMGQARRVGQRLLAGLRALAGRHEMVGDVRGAGLFLGLELVRDRLTLEPAADEATFVANRLRDHGILLGTDGPFHNVIKIRPPMPFDEQDADYLTEILDLVLAELA